jgi:hypothetical protein
MDWVPGSTLFPIDLKHNYSAAVGATFQEIEFQRWRPALARDARFQPNSCPGRLP